MKQVSEALQTKLAPLNPIARINERKVIPSFKQWQCEIPVKTRKVFEQINVS